MSALARNSAAALVLQVFRLGVQAAYFVALARALPVAGYGAFVGAAGLVGLAAPFAAWGAGDLLVQRVAREGAPFARAWGEALRTVALGGLGCLLVVVPLGRWLLPASVPTALLACVAAAECWGGALVSTAAQAFQARERMARAGAVWVTLSTARLVGALALLAGLARAGDARGVGAPAAWGAAYLATTAAAAAWAVWRVGRELGRPARPGARASGATAPGAAGQGFQYALGLAATSFYNDVDKTMLARLGTLGATGAYGAGARMVDLSFAPVTALLSASYARFFREGAGGVAPAARLARRLLPAALAYAGAAAAGLWLLAPAAVHVLGGGYREAADVVRLLAPLPLVRAWQYFAANALTGGGRQAERSAAQVAAAGLNVGLNLLWIPTHGWRGAAWATLAAESALAAALWACVARHTQRARPAPPAHYAPPAGKAVHV